MALLSNVTIVEKPTKQPDEPSAMTGPALEVFAVGPFQDPPKNNNSNMTLLLQYDNPVAGMSYNYAPGAAEEHDTSIPQYIYGTHQKVHDWDWGVNPPEVMMSQPYTLFKPANPSSQMYMGVFRGSLRPETITFANGAQPGLDTFTYSLNSVPEDIDNLLNSPSLGSDYFTNAAFEILTDTLRQTNEEGPSERAIHAWVMCDHSYILTNKGKVYKSSNGFNTASTAVGEGVHPNVARLHPGIIENPPIGL